jgi:O-antigen/teichoic acid export membrane protein
VTALAEGAVRRASRGAACGVLDQALSSGTNFLTAFVASAVLAPTDFAAFVVAYALVTIVLAVGRAVIGEPLLAYLPTVCPFVRPAVVRSVAGTALLLGLLGAALALAGGLTVGALGGLLWLAPWVPVVLLQDAARYVFLAEGRASLALLTDGVWAVVQIAALGAIALAGTFSVATLAAAWGLGALAGLVVVLTVGRTGFRPAHPADWARRTRHLSGWFTLTSILGQCEVYAVLVLAGLLLAPIDAAGLRVVQLLVFAPAVMLVTATVVLVTPAVARAVDRGDVAGLRAARRAGLVATTVLAAAVLAVIPLREVLLGALFPRYLGFGPLVVPLAVQTAAYVLAAPAIAVLRGFHRARTLAALHVSLSVALIASAAITMSHGVLVLGWTLAGVTAAAVVAMTLAAPRSERAVEGHTRRRTPATPPATATDTAGPARPALACGARR